MVVQDFLEVKQLQKQIGAKKILKDISFQVATGDLVAITGPNGAGKTTLMRILAGLLPKSGGEVLWNGIEYDLSHGRIGYVSHKPMVYETLSVYDNLLFFGQMYGTATGKFAQELLTKVGLWHYRHEPVAVLSRGMQQRLAIARSLMGKPRLILYDEPFTSLDVAAQTLLNTIFEEYRPQAIQLVISHELHLLGNLSYKELKLRDGQMEQGGVAGA